MTTGIHLFMTHGVLIQALAFIETHFGEVLQDSRFLLDGIPDLVTVLITQIPGEETEVFVEDSTVGTMQDIEMALPMESILVIMLVTDGTTEILPVQELPAIPQVDVPPATAATGLEEDLCQSHEELVSATLSM